MIISVFHYFTQNIKATNCFKLSIKSQGSPNYEAHARYHGSHNRSKRQDIIPKYGKTQKQFLLTDKRECFNKYACCKKLIRCYSGNGLVVNGTRKSLAKLVSMEPPQAYCAISKIFSDTLPKMTPSISDIEQKIRAMFEKKTQVTIVPRHFVGNLL